MSRAQPALKGVQYFQQAAVDRMHITGPMVPQNLVDFSKRRLAVELLREEMCPDGLAGMKAREVKLLLDRGRCPQRTAAATRAAPEALSRRQRLAGQGTRPWEALISHGTAW